MISLLVERVDMGDSSGKQLDLDLKEIKSSNGANLGFEEKMWKAADKLRNNMDARTIFRERWF
jgi:hypothetical protein